MIYKVSDLMTSNPSTLFEDNSLSTVSDLFTSKRIRHIPIVDKSDRLVGVVTQRDFIKATVSTLAKEPAGSSAYGTIPLKSIMTTGVRTVTADTVLSEAAHIMFENKYGCLPVLDNDGRVVGIITESDFVKAFAVDNALQSRSL